jgi:hypothetical protein
MFRHEVLVAQQQCLINRPRDVRQPCLPIHMCTHLSSYGFPCEEYGAWPEGNQGQERGGRGSINSREEMRLGFLTLREQETLLGLSLRSL